MWYSSVMPQCSNQRTSERAQLLSAMTHPSTVLDLDAKQSFVTPKSYIYIYTYTHIYIHTHIALSKLNGTTSSVSLGYQHGAGFFGVGVSLRISCHLQFVLVCVLHLLVFAAPNSP